MLRTISLFFALLLVSASAARGDDGTIPAWRTFGGGPSAYAFALDPAQARAGAPSLKIAALTPTDQEDRKSVV